ncbi:MULTISPECIES: hypothetical protein [Nostoc]|uniref:hypothetical protein n=1 Tax=Nostoc TaxID=1177 RepID=UPI001F54E90F|nr:MULTISPECIES: hypothetical protein [Nostoc]
MSIPLLDQPTEEKLVTLKDISWEQCKGIETQLVDNRNVRLSYLSGMLEILSPIGEEHESVKKNSRLFARSLHERVGYPILRSWWLHLGRTGVCFRYTG